MKDFEVQPDGQILPPTIEIDFRESQHPTIAVSAFMSGMITSIANGFEMMLVHLCNANTRPSPAFPVYIDMPAENRRSWKQVRFAFGTRFMGNDDFLPIG